MYGLVIEGDFEGCREFVDSLPEPLSREEQKQLAIKAKQGDTEARKQLIETNMRFVAMKAREFQKVHHYPLEDLIQQGTIGLIRALDSFDPERGVKLVSYAALGIYQQMYRMWIKDANLNVRGLLGSNHNFVRKLAKAKEKLEGEGVEPTVSALAKESGLDKWRIVCLSHSMHTLYYDRFDSPIKEEDNFLDYLTHTPAEQDKGLYWVRELVADFSEVLDKRSRDIFVHRIVDHHHTKLRVLGKKYGISRERVRQIEADLREDFRLFLEQRGITKEDVV